MKSEKAIEILEEVKELDDTMYAYNPAYMNAMDMAIEALKEIQQYREIGTVEQVKNQKENLNVAYQIINDYEQYGTIEDFKMAQRYMRLVKSHGTIGQVINSCAEYEEIGTVEECREAKRFKEYFDELYGIGLEVANWHQNGDTEPFDNFYDAAIDWSEQNAKWNGKTSEDENLEGMEDEQL